MTILVTGGAGFIGSAVCRHLIESTDQNVVVVDKLTYASNVASLEQIVENRRFKLHRIDICNFERLSEVITEVSPTAILHLAAESHVDRSILGSDVFIETNIMGTYNLLKAARAFWETLGTAEKEAFRLIHISTDEVFGSLGKSGKFSENSKYDPSSPYSASKASSDHLVSAWYRTFGLPTINTNCSNNYGTYQNPEKLIPLMTINCLEGQPLPVYGDGKQVRDWLFVDDHVSALMAVLEDGTPGETYCIGGDCERRNIDVVRQICEIVDELDPAPYKRESLIESVTDRLGHDTRYAIDATKVQALGNWNPKESFETGLRKTVNWYMQNKSWWREVRRAVEDT